jgi:Ala-tRNA(Pro) deacylase
MRIPERLIAFLNSNDVRYKIIHHPVAYTAQELAAIEHVKGRNHAKVVVAKAASHFLLVLPADHRVDLDRLGQLTGEPTRLATEAEFKSLFTDCELGTMPPFGRLYGIETWLDVNFDDAGQIVFEAGTHTDAIRMAHADYVRLAQPRLADFARKGQI